jgi:hypothetical protein
VRARRDHHPLNALLDAGHALGEVVQGPHLTEERP